MQIFISVGHNNAFNFINDHGKIRLSLYRDQGAVVGVDTEYRFCRKVANEIAKKFNGTVKYRFVFVPEGLNLQERIAWINKRAVDTDLCIELHLDSIAVPPGKTSPEGCTTWYMSGANIFDKAIDFQKEYTRVTGIKGRGVKGDMENRLGRLAFVRDTRPMAFLLEMGFLSNENDRNLVWTKAAAGIYSAIQKIL